jgi:hypothetical protein
VDSPRRSQLTDDRRPSWTQWWVRSSEGGEIEPIVERSPRLERRLRAWRYERAFRACAEILQGLGIDVSKADLVPVEELDSIWDRYIVRLRELSHEALRWPVEDRETVESVLSDIREAVGSRRVVWLPVVDSEPVGVEVRADGVLGAALACFVTRAGDLMLASRDTADGICVELNHFATGDYYDVVTWGFFRAP